jgi:hypothetical protein
MNFEQTTLRNLRDRTLSELYECDALRKLCKAIDGFPDLEELLRKLDTLSHKDTKDDACVFFDQESLEEARQVVDRVKSKLVSFYGADMSFVDLDTEAQNDTNPQLEERGDEDPTIYTEETTVTVKAVPVPQTATPSTPFPLPPADAKPGYKTRVCTKIPKYNKLTTGYPCTFGKGCTYAHSAEEANFYRALSGCSCKN